jgi:hypothetical protein
MFDRNLNIFLWIKQQEVCDIIINKKKSESIEKKITVGYLS